MTVWATRADQVDLRGPNPHDLARSLVNPRPLGDDEGLQLGAVDVLGRAQGETAIPLNGEASLPARPGGFQGDVHPVKAQDGTRHDCLRAISAGLAFESSMRRSATAACSANAKRLRSSRTWIIFLRSSSCAWGFCQNRTRWVWSVTLTTMSSARWMRSMRTSSGSVTSVANSASKTPKKRLTSGSACGRS